MKKKHIEAKQIILGEQYDKKQVIIIAIVAFIVLLTAACMYSKHESQKAAEEAYQELYDYAYAKYGRYCNEAVSGQEVIDLVENWDETEFSIDVDIPYGEDIDPKAQYEAVFVMYQSPTDPSDKGIEYLKFQPVEED